MFTDLLLESCEEGGGGGGGGGLSLLGDENEPIFRGYVLPDQPEFLVIFYKLFQLRQTHRIANASFFTGHIWEVYTKKLSVIIIEHHMYAHCTFRLHINAQTFQHLPVNKM